MRCKEIEQLIIDSSGKNLNREELLYLERHLSSCDRCACLKEDLSRIRQGLEAMPMPRPSDDLDRQTYFKCHAKLNTMNEVKSMDFSHVLFISKATYAILFILTILTVLWSVHLLKDFSMSEPISLETIVVLTLMIQNSVMLCFSPLLIRRHRWKSLKLRMI